MHLPAVPLYTQVPLFGHVSGEQWSDIFSQYCPDHPSLHTHANEDDLFRNLQEIVFSWTQSEQGLHPQGSWELFQWQNSCELLQPHRPHWRLAHNRPIDFAVATDGKLFSTGRSQYLPVYPRIKKCRAFSKRGLFLKECHKTTSKFLTCLVQQVLIRRVLVNFLVHLILSDFVIPLAHAQLNSPLVLFTVHPPLFPQVELRHKICRWPHRFPNVPGRHTQRFSGHESTHLPPLRQKSW